MAGEPGFHVAHAAFGAGLPRYHALDEHLRETAASAKAFAAAFSAGDWAWLAGLWHDLGKFRPPFQHKLLSAHDPDGHIETRERSERGLKLVDERRLVLRCRPLAQH